MAMSKEQYLDSIRSNSAYPVYRGVIGTIAMLGYILAVFYGLAALVMGIGGMRTGFLYGLGILILGLILAALTFLMVRFFKEGALILADIGDSVTDANSRTLPDERASAASK
jgi:uncharacterized membrane protein